MVNISDIIKRELIEKLGKKEQDFVGCSPEQIDSIKTAQGVFYLPSVYTDFLLTMGQRAGGLHIGTDWLYYHLPSLKKFAKVLLIESGTTYQLPDDAFVFLMHQGYQFMFFRTNEQVDDPTIYYYMENEIEPVAKDYTLAEFLRQSAADLISHLKA